MGLAGVCLNTIELTATSFLVSPYALHGVRGVDYSVILKVTVNEFLACLCLALLL